MATEGILVLLLACFVIAIKIQFTNAQPPDATEPPREKVICKIDPEQPKYMPNIYECRYNEWCCENEGLPSCCGKDITQSAVLEQLILWLILLGVLLLVGIIAYCYFNDHYCCEGGDDDDGDVGCLCCKKRAADRYRRKKFDTTEVFYPDQVAATRVDDPIFGKLGRPDEVPAYAHVDEETTKKARFL